MPVTQHKLSSWSLAGPPSRAGGMSIPAAKRARAAGGPDAPPVPAGWTKYNVPPGPAAPGGGSAPQYAHLFFVTQDRALRVAWCRVCRHHPSITMPVGSGWSNVLRHMLRNHAHLLTAEEDTRAEAAGGAGREDPDEAATGAPPPRSVAVMLGGKRTVDLTDAVTEFIRDSNLPFSVASHHATHTLMAQVCKLIGSPEVAVKLPSRQRVAAMLTEDAERALNQIAAELRRDLRTISDMTGMVNVDIDGWSDRRLRGYAVINFHWTTPEGILRHATVAVQPFAGERHTAAVVLDMLRKVARRLGLAADDATPIERFAASITTDNGSNMLAIASQAEAPWLKVRCGAHSLQLAITSLLEGAAVCHELRIPVDSIKRAVGLFANSGARRDRYKEAWHTVRPGTTVLMPIFWNATRWNSVFYVILRYFEMHHILYAMAPADLGLTAVTKPLMMSGLENAVLTLRPVVPALLLIWATTERLSANDACTYSLFPAAVDEIVVACTPSADVPEASATILNAIRAQVEARFADLRDDNDRNMLIAVFLDPRTVSRRVRFGDDGRLTAASSAHVNRIITALRDDMPGPVDNGLDIGIGAAAPPVDALKPEVTSYLVAVRDMTVEQRGEIDNPLADFWCLPVRCHTKLAQLARRYLGIRPTEAEAERAASLAGLVHTARRSSMSPGRLRDVVLAAAWSRTVMRRAATARGARARPAAGAARMQARVERAIAALNPVAPAQPPPAAIGVEAVDADEPMVVVEEEVDEGDLHEALADAREGVLHENGDLDLGGAVAVVAAAIEGELDEDAPPELAGVAVGAVAGAGEAANTGKSKK